MRFKSLLLGAASIAVIGTASQAQAGPFYVSVFGGLNFLTDKSAATSFTRTRNITRFHTTFTHTGTISEKSQTGFVLGGAVGVHLDNWVDGLRGELEASYRRNHIHGNFHTHVTSHIHTGGEGSRTQSTSANGIIFGHMSTFAIMANVWYDIDIGSRFKPYVGGGIGWARSRVDLRGVTTTGKGGSSTTATNENNGFAYQLGAGVRYEIMHDASIGIGYRYFRGPDVNIFFGGEGFVNDTPMALKFRDENHSVDLSLSIDID